jgi:hypothetical protein
MYNLLSLRQRCTIGYVYDLTFAAIATATAKTPGIGCKPCWGSR